MQEAHHRLIAAAHKDPALAGVFTMFRASTPQLFADVDRVKANMLNFPLCVLLVFLVHSAEYESWTLPLEIILQVGP